MCVFLIILFCLFVFILLCSHANAVALTFGKHCSVVIFSPLHNTLLILSFLYLFLLVLLIMTLRILPLKHQFQHPTLRETLLMLYTSGCLLCLVGSWICVLSSLVWKHVMQGHTIMYLDSVLCHSLHLYYPEQCLFQNFSTTAILVWYTVLLRRRVFLFLFSFYLNSS